METWFCCVHLPEFAAQSLLRLREERRESAVAVVEGAAPLERVCSVNRRASAMGVRRGMTRAELDSFDGLCVLRRSAAEEEAARAAVMEVAGGFTPRVESLTAGPHGTEGACVVVLDVSGTERLFGPVETLARRVVKALGALGLSGCVAASANVLTAVVMARWMAVQGRAVRRVERGGEARELGELPVSTLKLTEEQAETMGAWGLRSLGELASLPEVEVVVRLGQEGGRLWRMARGRGEHLLVPEEPGLRLEEVVEFDEPVDGMESLMFVLGPMLDQLIARAGNRALELASVRVAMALDEHGGGEDGSAEAGSGCGGEHVRTIKPALPVADRVLLLKLLHLDMEAHPPATGVVRLRVTAEPGARSKVQGGLFSPPLPEPGRLEVTLARLAGLVGEQWVGSPRLQDSHAPESFVMEKFRLPEEPGEKAAAWRPKEGGARARAEARIRGELGDRENVPEVVTKVEVGSGPGDRGAAAEPDGVLRFTALRTEEGGGTEVAEAGAPAATAEVREGGAAVALRRMRPPVPIRWKGSERKAFWMQGVLYEVRERYGPWRRSGSWWTGSVWSQEEWDATVEAGAGVRLLCVLRQDLLADRWFLEAIYD